MNTKDLLHERNETHGSFIVNSRVGQGLKRRLRNEESWDDLSDVHKEALDFICSKIGRIMAGQAEFEDHWDDIAGYAKLPEKFNHGRDEQPRLASDSSSSDTNPDISFINIPNN